MSEKHKKHMEFSNKAKKYELLFFEIKSNFC